jgi:streptomycin 6-kinase
VSNVVARTVPLDVRRKAEALGDAGHAWLRALPDLVADLEAAWHITIGAPFDGGSSGYVAPAQTRAGESAIVKLAIPDGLVGNSPFALELEALRLANGKPYVRVLRSDLDRRAMLLERLGRPLAALALPVEQQIDVIASTVQSGWRPVEASPLLRTGADQASFLESFVAGVWDELDRPCAPAVVDRALEYAQSRRDAFDDGRAVLIHGDVHPANVLEAARAHGEFRLIDPDGMRSEPAHDLALPLRDWTDELLAGDPLALGQAWCARLAEQAHIDPQPIWEWAFLERVSTGLFILQLGDPQGARFLAVAERWMT